MAVRTIDEVMTSLRNRLGEAADDDTLGLIEDISDTLNDYQHKTEDNTNWQTRYEENDKQWREKYKARFFNPKSNEEPDNNTTTDDEDEPAVLTFEKLFKEG